MNKEEYEDLASEQRRSLREQMGRPIGERVFPENRLGVECAVVCSSWRCPNYGKTFHIRVDENADCIYRVYCARCGNQVHDVKPIFDDGVGDKLPTNAEEAEAHEKKVADRVREKNRRELR